MRLSIILDFCLCEIFENFEWLCYKEKTNKKKNINKIKLNKINPMIIHQSQKKIAYKESVRFLCRKLILLIYDYNLRSDKESCRVVDWT